MSRKINRGKCRAIVCILLISACATIINRVFASECNVSAIKKQQKIDRRGEGSPGSHRATAE